MSYDYVYVTPAEYAEFEKDRARLDWLLTKKRNDDKCVRDFCYWDREEIDAAMTAKT